MPLIFINLRETNVQYFITGASGFIGKRLVRKLLERDDSIVYFLIREGEHEARHVDTTIYCELQGPPKPAVYLDEDCRALGITLELEHYRPVPVGCLDQCEAVSLITSRQGYALAQRADSTRRR